MWENVPNGIPNIHARSLALMEDTLLVLNNKVNELIINNEDLNSEISGLNSEVEELNDEINNLNEVITEIREYNSIVTDVV